MPLHVSETETALLRASAAAVMQKVLAAREDFATFFEFAWYTPDGFAIDVQPFHREWIRALDEHRWLLLLAARNHGKSELLSARLVWELGRNSESKIKLACQSDKRAQTMLRSIKLHLTKNPLLKLVFPELRKATEGVWSNTQIEIERRGAGRDPSVDALGVMSTVVGGRSTILVIDDPLDTRTAILQPKSCAAVNMKVLQDWIPTLEPGGRCWIVMTPRSRKDLAAVIQTMRGWKIINTPVGDETDPCKPIWPTRFPREALAELRNDVIGPTEYAREYQLKVTSDEITPIRPAWIRYYSRELLGNPDDLLCVISFDLAISQATDADYFAWNVQLYDTTRNLIFIADAGRDRLSFSAQAQKVLELAAAWQADQIVIEQANYEGALAQHVAELATSPIPIITVKPRVKKERRVLGITPLLEGKRIWFHPKLNPKENPDLPYTGDLVGEMIDFPVGKHDDMIDAMVTGIQAVRDMTASGQIGGVGDGGTVGVSVAGGVGIG